MPCYMTLCNQSAIDMSIFSLCLLSLSGDIIFFFLHFQMSWSVFPLFVTDATLLDHEYALEWCSKNLLMEADFFPDLVPALCHAFSKDEEQLHLLVRNKFQDKEDYLGNSLALGRMFELVFGSISHLVFNSWGSCGWFIP